MSAARKLRLVKPDEKPSPLGRITVGSMYADILVDRRGSDGEVWHYILQREGSLDIVFWGNCSTEEEARKLAKDLLNQYRAHAVNAAAS